MEDIKPIIAKNITDLRVSKKMTQLELAEKLNYSDKAISKWERGESVPDIAVLKHIADIFGVQVDYLLEETHEEKQEVQEKPAEVTADSRRNRTVVTTLSVLLVWLVATLFYVLMDLIVPDLEGRWLSFIYALPVSMIVWLVFNSIWFKPRRNYLIISLLVWTTLASLVATLLTVGIAAWQLFVLGVPGQLIILVWSCLQGRNAKQKN